MYIHEPICIQAPIHIQQNNMKKKKMKVNKLQQIPRKEEDSHATIISTYMLTI